MAKLPALKPPRTLAGIAGIFGVMTVVSGSSVLFGPAHVRALAGDVVTFVLWFNVLAGVAYILAAIWIWRGDVRASTLAWAIALTTAAVALAFAAVALRDVPVEPRTAGALFFRTFFWAGSAIWLSRRRLS